MLSSVRAEVPTLSEWLSAVCAALLLILAFPNFHWFPLAWIALSPLLVSIARRPANGRAYVLGWASGTLFFYVSCYWLTYSMIHYGGLSAPLAYLLLVPAALLVGVFIGLFAALISITVDRWGSSAVLLAPLFWSALEWCRLQVTGQLWNAIGYSQAEAFSGSLIQSARWGGVYLVGALVVLINAAVAYLILNKSKRGLTIFTISIACVVLIGLSTKQATIQRDSNSLPYLNVVALQPNVPMSPMKTERELKELFNRHLILSENALRNLQSNGLPTLVVWPESPMNFTYASDEEFRNNVTKFVTRNHTSLLFNSLEPASDQGAYNSAVLINEDGRLIAQYDKIRLMPFGEYVPLPHWLPGASLITGLVGDFAPGKDYVLMPLGGLQIGTFICIESAYPFIARQFTKDGADVLINISNDGYLGPTAVMRQHLANAVFRAVENGRPLLSITNSGLTAYIRPDGVVVDQTSGFEIAVRTWRVGQSGTATTFYTRHGDFFVESTTVASLLILVASLFVGRRSSKSRRWKKT